MDEIKSRLNWKEIAIQIVVLLFMFGFRFLPPFGEMTPLGMQILGIFIGALLGWIFSDMNWTNLVGLVAISLTAAYASTLDVLHAGFGSQNTILVFGSLMFCAYMETIDLSGVILGFMMNLPIAKKGPYWLAFCYYVACFIVSLATVPPVAILLCVDLYKKLAESANVPLRSPVCSFWLSGIGLIAVFGDIGLPFKPTAAVMLSGYESIWGQPLSYATYCLFMTIPLLLFIVMYLVICKYVLRINLDAFKNAAVVVEKVKMNKQQKYGMVFLCFTMALLLLPGMISGSSNPLGALLSRLGNGGIMIAILAIMTFVRCDGKPVLDIPKVASRFNWGCYLLVVFFFTAIPLISNNATGFPQTISSFFAPIMSSMPPIIFVFMCIILAAILTNFLSNAVISIIFMTLVASCQSILPGISMPAASLAIMMASFLACATPAANANNAIVFSFKDVIDFKYSLIHGWKVVLVMTVLVMIIYFPIVSFLV